MRSHLISVMCLAMIAGSSFSTDWTVPGNFASIQDAMDSIAVLNGDTIRVGPGDHAGAFVTKAVTIEGEGGARITSGPVHPSGLSQGFRIMSGGGYATISHFTFTTQLSIMNGGPADNVTVTQCTFLDSVQAISNWGGSQWEISHNKIVDLSTRNGGGIGILVADRFATPGGVHDNVVSHNTIEGTLHVWSGDGGGYNGSGIVLYSDARYGWPGALAISYNRVVKNKVAMASDNMTVVDIVAFELTDASATPGINIITQNHVGFNDFRGTALQIALTPGDLDTVNDFSRNLGTNRGHGLHPGLFGPGGN